jgi:hypothetical protein
MWMMSKPLSFHALPGPHIAPGIGIRETRGLFFGIMEPRIRSLHAERRVAHAAAAYSPACLQSL